MGTPVSSILEWMVAVAFVYVTNCRWGLDSKVVVVRAITREAIVFSMARIATGELDWA